MTEKLPSKSNGVYDRNNNITNIAVKQLFNRCEYTSHFTYTSGQRAVAHREVTFWLRLICPKWNCLGEKFMDTSKTTKYFPRIVPEVSTVTTQSSYTNQEKVKCHELVIFFIQGSKKFYPVVLETRFSRWMSNFWSSLAPWVRVPWASHPLTNSSTKTKKQLPCLVKVCIVVAWWKVRL